MSQKLTAKRLTLKKMIVRVVKYTEAIPDDTPVELLNTKMELLDQNYELCFNTHLELMEYVGAEGRDFEETEFDSIQTFYETAKTRLKMFIADSAAAADNGSSDEEDGARATVPAPVREIVKLPQIIIPQFSGDFSQWQSFRDLFLNSIGDRRDLRGAQKLQYLKSFVAGEAAKLVRAYNVTDDNYRTAWKVLCGRYDNKRLLLNAHMKRLFDQPSATHESAAAIRNLIDTTTECVKALASLDLPTDKWDAILVYIVVQRLDADSHKQWELSLAENSIPEFKELSEFMERRCRSLEAYSSMSVSASSGPSKRTPPKPQRQAVHHVQSNPFGSCVVCGKGHAVVNCAVFEGLSVAARRDMVKSRRLCFICLLQGHLSTACKQPPCATCDGKHHTLLHFADKTTKPEDTNSVVQANFGSSYPYDKQVLLSTAYAKINDMPGRIRILMDNGSHVTLIRERCVQRLGLRRQSVSVPIGGLAGVDAGTSKSKVEVQLRSCFDDKQIFNVTALVMPQLTKHLPIQSVSVSHRPDFDDLQLADPTYYKPGDVEMIIGADVCGMMLREGLRLGCVERGREMPTAVNTALGWVLTGPVPTKPVVRSDISTAAVVNLHLDVACDLRQFWEIEEVPAADMSTDAERKCETHFEQTHTRDAEGRYVVRMPFSCDPNAELGDSRETAERRLRQIERRLSARPELRAQYCDFMREYAALGHMQPATRREPNKVSYYLPHHFVLKESSTTTKLRVVFDASCRTTSGKSLNDTQLVGPALQDDLSMIILRFRRHAVALTADITKMYRQVAVHEGDWDFQRILWRNEVTDDIQEWHLKTVTYGMAASSFLAVRALRQLAHDEQQKYPSAASVVLRDFYVDDLITGTHSSREAIELYKGLVNMMSRGGFELRKWASNCEQTLAAIPASMRESSHELRLDNDAPVRTLGLLWHPAADCFAFSIELPVDTGRVTKRSVLSAVAKLFDPLGLLAPCVIVAKMLIQRLWTVGIDWDEDVPEPLLSSWKQYHNSLPALERMKFPRWIGVGQGVTMQLHCFADASESAYGGVVYLRCEMPDGNVRISLLTAKTKVAPLQQITLPRLELCAAVLATKLLRYVQSTYDIDANDCVLWSDSQVTLSWIRKAPRTWKTFVANRVSTIQGIVSPDRWRYVPTADNPADCLSRGLQPAELVDFALWLNGPKWMAADATQWPKDDRCSETHLDERPIQACLLTVAEDDGGNLLLRYSSITRLQRVTALVLRFAHNCRTDGSMRRYGEVTAAEMRDALTRWMLRVQADVFEREINCCAKKLDMPKNSKLRRLNPFLDESGLLRLGGRLRNADLATEAIHPVVLPGASELVTLIIADAHHQLLHGGAQIMLNFIRQRFWILGARGRVRQYVRCCITCFRQKPRGDVQQMGNLPRIRVTPSRAFSSSGVDYAGPMLYKSRSGRGFRTEKGYVALFVCLATKAIHLEFVSELTTAAFLAAFRRFVARRGKCNDLLSDNATNFVGARRELGDILRSHEHNDEIARTLAQDGTNWRMIPPRSPHIGGLWEAGVKAMKHHLRRVIGEQLLTFEEYATLLAEIEAVLNSRPLCALSDDPTDLTALTPGHFLVGGPPVVVPERDLQSTSQNRLTRWQLVSQMVQHFWRRWRQEYLSTLQQRTKWLEVTPNVQVGQLALIKDELLPSAKWRLGRIISIQPGDDGHVRVVSLKTANGDTTRAVSRICTLPIN